MNPGTLPISRLISVVVNLSPLAAQAQSLSDLLVLASSDVIDVTERMRTYATLAAVADDFGTSGPEYASALRWFGQSPQPTQLKVGRWAKTATKGLLRGGALSVAQQLITTWTAVNSGSLELEIDAVPKSITGLNFSAVTNMNGVASVLQTALAAAAAGTTCVWDANYDRFTIESGTSGVGSSISFAQAPTSTGFITFAANPTALDTITLNGTVVTFVSTTPGANEVARAGTLAATMTNLLTFLQASTDTQLVKFTYNIVTSGGNKVLELEAATPGVGGDSLTIAASAATPSGATLSGGTGTDISGMLNMLSSSSGAYTADGIAAETAAEAVAVFDGLFGQGWYGLVMPEAVNAEHLAVAAYIEAANNKHIYGATTQEAGVLSTVSTTDLAYLLSASNYRRSVVQYSSKNGYAICSLLGRALTVNYTGSATVITMMYKQEPGEVAETLNASQIAALEAKNCNVFVAYNNNTAIVEQGKMASGDFIDEVTGTDWLAVTIMTSMYNLLYTSPTKIPQTDPGEHILVVGCEAVCSQGVNNGLLAPGVWNSNGFGTLKTGDYLAKGFYVYAPPVASQAQADREARKSVPIQIAAKLAGAVHTVDISIVVNR